MVIEDPGAGSDMVYITLPSYTLGDTVEKLAYTGSGAFSGTGNALDNKIVGGKGADTLFGGAGDDRPVGGGRRHVVRRR